MYYILVSVRACMVDYIVMQNGMFIHSYVICIYIYIYIHMYIHIYSYVRMFLLLLLVLHQLF